MQIGMVAWTRRLRHWMARLISWYASLEETRLLIIGDAPNDLSGLSDEISIVQVGEGGLALRGQG